MLLARYALFIFIFASACALEPAVPDRIGVQLFGVRVDQVAGCSTAAVAGLSTQLVDEQNCIRPNALVSFSALANLDIAAGVNALLEPVAVTALGNAAQAASSPLQINSAFRTLAQQYLLKKWEGTCGITLAADPGNSNHETGIAVDVANWQTEKAAMTAHAWTWFGDADQVHFDYNGAGAVDLRGDSVLAFQRLWNRNHADDTIAEDSAWGPSTEARMAASPAEGFAIGASCSTVNSDGGVSDLSSTTDLLPSAADASAPADLVALVDLRNDVDDLSNSNPRVEHPLIRGGCAMSSSPSPLSLSVAALVLVLLVGRRRKLS